MLFFVVDTSGLYHFPPYFFLINMFIIMEDRKYLAAEDPKNFSKKQHRASFYSWQTSDFFHVCSGDQSLLKKYPQLFCRIPSAI